MHYLVMLFLCFAISSLSAETIGNVEYQLPKQVQGWKLSKELNGSEKIPSTTRIYTPSPQSKESFAAHINSFTTKIVDKDSLQDGIEKGMKLKYTNPKATVSLLEQSPNSALYEWSVSDSGEEKIHGWTRVFSSPKDTTMLTYQTEQISQINDVRPIWLPILKEAKSN